LGETTTCFFFFHYQTFFYAIFFVFRFAGQVFIDNSLTFSSQKKYLIGKQFYAGGPALASTTTTTKKNELEHRLLMMMEAKEFFFWSSAGQLYYPLELFYTQTRPAVIKRPNIVRAAAGISKKV
jgi:hypothetical protein